MFKHYQNLCKKLLWIGGLLLIIGLNCNIALASGIPALTGSVNISGVVDQPTDNDNFNDLLEETIDPIADKLDNTTIGIKFGGPDAVVIFVIDVFKTYIFPLVILLAVLTAIFGFIEIMTADTEDKRSKGINYFIRGVVGIIVFISAEFIFNGLYGVINKIAESSGLDSPSWNVYAGEIFDNIAYPFLKLAMYLIMWWLFIVLLIKAIWFITSPSDKAPQQWMNIIISAIIGILVILSAKTLVEAVYSKQELILEETNGSITVGAGLLNESSQDYQVLFTIINYILGLIAFIVLCIIIYQAYLMLFTANTDDSIKKMRKNLLYIFAGLLLIWLSYVIVNFVIIN